MLSLSLYQSQFVVADPFFAACVNHLNQTYVCLLLYYYYFRLDENVQCCCSISWLSDVDHRDTWWPRLSQRISVHLSISWYNP